MPTTILTNPTLKKLTEGLPKPPGSLLSSSDINLNPYYLLVNPDNQDEAYFCFPKTVVAG
jgi:hypothetical protein